MKWDVLIDRIHLYGLFTTKGSMTCMILTSCSMFAVMYFMCIQVTWIPLDADSWREFGDDLKNKDDITCEIARDENNEFVKQFYSSLSSITYVLSAIFLFAVFLTDLYSVFQPGGNSGRLIERDDEIRRSNRLDDQASLPSLLLRQPIWTLLFGLNFLLLGITSFIYHASLSVMASYLDLFSWWALVFTILNYSMARFLCDGIPPEGNLCCLFRNCGCSCSLACEAKGKQRNSIVVSFLCVGLTILFDVIVGLNLGVMSNEATTIGVITFFLFLTIFFFWMHWYLRSSDISVVWAFFGFSVVCVMFSIAGLQIDRALCNPKSWFQGHIIFHAFSNFAILGIYFLFRSDKWVTVSDVERIPSKNSGSKTIANVVLSRRVKAGSKGSYSSDNSPSPTRSSRLGSKEMPHRSGSMYELSTRSGSKEIIHRYSRTGSMEFIISSSQDNLENATNQQQQQQSRIRPGSKESLPKFSRSGSMEYSTNRDTIELPMKVEQPIGNSITIPRLSNGGGSFSSSPTRLKPRHSSISSSASEPLVYYSTSIPFDRIAQINN